MRPHIYGFIVTAFLTATVTGCGSKLDNFNDVRDYIIGQTGESFRTTVELSVNTDNFGIMRNHVKDFNFDTNEYHISGIEKVEFGIYRVQDCRAIHISDQLLPVDVKKMTRRLNRAGFDVIIQKLTEEEISLGLIKETSRSKPGAGYFIRLEPDNFLLVKVDGDFRKS